MSASRPSAWMRGIILIAVAAFGCSDTVSAPRGTENDAVAEFDVSSVGNFIRQGGTLQLVAVIRNGAGQDLAGRVVTWSSSDPGIATVSPAGLVTGVARSGDVTIRAECEGKKDSLLLHAHWLHMPPVLAVRQSTFTMFDEAQERPIPVLVRVPVGAALPLPVVFVISPGPVAHLADEDLGGALASAGYAVVHFATPTPDKTKLCADLAVPSNECATILVPERLAAARAASSLVNQLSALASGANTQLDPTRIGVAGYSAGASVAMMLAGATVSVSDSRQDVSLQDTRFRVILGNSAPGVYTANGTASGFSSTSYQSVVGSAMQQTSKGDAPAPRLEPFESMPPGEKYLAYFDTPLVGHGAFGLGAGAPFGEYIRYNSVVFFEAHLRGVAEAREWLKSDQLSVWTSGVARVTSK